MNQLGLSEPSAPKTVKCPKCNVLNFGDRRACEGCGVRLSASSTIAGESYTPLGTCVDCGKVISNNAVACPHCGRSYNPGLFHPTVWLIAGGVIIGYLGILVINFVVAFFVLVFLSGVIVSSFNNAQPPRYSSPSSR